MGVGDNHLLYSFLTYSTDCNVTIILGKFTLEDESKAPNVLLVHISGMLCKDFASTLWSFAGRKGFEIRQNCVSSCKVCHETDRDWL